MPDGITSLGAGSGLDLAGLVDQLVASERQTREGRVVTAEAATISQLSAFGQIQGAAAALEDGLESLQDLATYRGRTATTENEEIFTVTADENAATGTYAIEVVALAEAQKLRTDAFESSSTGLGTGRLTISSTENSFAITIDEEANSLADIRDAINSSSENTSVTAGIVNSAEGAHLVLAGTRPGEKNAFTITVSDGDGGLDSLNYANDETDDSGSGFTVVSAASDAELIVDGLEIISSSNSISTAIEGVSLDLLKAEEGTSYALTVDFDREGAQQQVQNFVNGYNNLLLTISNQVNFNVETFQSGPLFGDSAIRSLVSDARGVVNSASVGSFDTISSLAQIGITTNLDGSLAIDESALEDALAENFDEVGSLFAGEDGLASRLGSLLGGYLEPTGRLTTRTESLELRLDDFSDQREAINERLVSFEARVRSQFTALDSLLSELNNTSNFLTQQLASLPGSTSN